MRDVMSADAIIVARYISCRGCGGDFGKRALGGLCRPCYAASSPLPKAAALARASRLIADAEPPRRPRRSGRARSRLAAREGQRLRFRARVARFGIRRARKGRVDKTILMVDVSFADSGAFATEHMWFDAGAWSKNMSEGDVLEFDGRIAKYQKGYWGGERINGLIDREPKIDWRIGSPGGFVNLTREWEDKVRRQRVARANIRSGRERDSAAVGFDGEFGEDDI